MGFYNLNPDRIRDLQSPDPGELLLRDGANIASVIALLSKTSEISKKRIEEYLAKVVPGIKSVKAHNIGPKETIEFRQNVAGANDPWSFYASNMSDGTLRALGILVALFQNGHGSSRYIPLVGIEEPEIALHPAAVGAILDGIKEASARTQVVVTSHSPDLLDSDDIDTDSILAVATQENISTIAPIDENGREALHRKLFTPGELLSMNQLNPIPIAWPEAFERQLKLFDEDI